MRKYVLPAIILALIGLDQWLKYYIVSHFELGQAKPWIPGFMSLTYLRNYGAAFSILQNQRWLFAIMTVVIMAWAIWYLIKHINGSRWLLTALVLLIAGGIGNFIDRLRLGYVVDMFQTDFIDFAVFNVADTYLTVGVCLLFIIILKEDTNGNSH